MDLLLQLFIAGVVLGSQFALVGLSFGIIYAVTKTFHFAHGLAFAAAGYAAWLSVDQLRWPVWLSVVAGVAAAIAVGVACEAIVYRRIRERGGTPAAMLMASLGIFIVGQNVLQLAFGSDARAFSREMLQPIPIGFAIVTMRDITTVIGALAAIALVLGVFRFSSAGRVLRAVVDSAPMSSVVGIDLGRAYLLAYVLGSAIAAVAAVMYVSYAGATPAMGLNIFFAAVGAVVIGGIGSLYGAAIAGFLLGLGQDLLVFRIGNEWQSSLVFVAMILFFLLRPQGLFGQLARLRV